MNIAALSVQRKIMVNLFFLIIVIVGVWKYVEMPREFFPSAHLNQAVVVIPYRGASAPEIEQQITNKIEESVAELEGLDDVQGRSGNGAGTVLLFIEEGTDTDKFMLDLQAAVNGIPDLPEEALDPIYLEIDASLIQPVCYIALGGEVAESVLLEVAEDIQKEIRDINGVTKADIEGIRHSEVHVEVDPDLLDHYGLSFGEVMMALEARNLNMPGGTSETGGTAYNLRVLGKFESLSDIGNTIVRSVPGQGQVRVEQIAAISEVLEDRRVFNRLNGKPSGHIVVYKNERGNLIEISEAIHGIVDRYSATLPMPVELEIRLDSADLVSERVGVMTKNAWLTALVVGAMLFFFLGWSNALLVLIGIPFTFLTAFIFMSWAGMSINMLTLFALIMALGMIVDDAIIVVDNTHRHMERGLPPDEAAVKGTREVMFPVIAAVLTTVSGFLPILLMTGMIGKFMSSIPKTVAFALLASLVEALIILPAHTAELGRFNRWLRGKLGMQSRKGGEAGGARLLPKQNPAYLALRKAYRRQLAFTLRHRYLAVLAVIVVAFMSLGLLRLLPVKIFPEEDFDQVVVQFETPAGTTLDKTNEIALQIEDIVAAMPTAERDGIVSAVGYQVVNYEFLRGDNRGEINLDLVSAADRDRSDLEIMGELREKISEVPGIARLTLSRPQGGPPTGKPVEIHVLGPRLKVLEELGGMLKDELASLPGVVDVRDDFDRSLREVQITVDEDRLAPLGLTSRDIALTVSAAFHGAEATQFTNADGEDQNVIVRLGDKHRDRAETLSRLKIVTRSGAAVPISSLASFDKSRALSMIRHFDSERAITITADILPGENTSMAVNQAIQERFANFNLDYPGYRLDFGGEFERTEESFRSLLLLLPIAFLCIFMILAAQFNSLFQPLIVLFTVPFSFIGVVVGLIVMGYEFTIPAMVGIISLMGLVVNNSLVMVAFINRARDEGSRRWASIIRSGTVRMRPILLTTITTIAGLSTLTIASTGATRIMVPMAVSMIWGLAFATVLTLFLIPSLMAISDDVSLRLKMGRRWKHLSERAE